LLPLRDDRLALHRADRRRGPRGCPPPSWHAPAPEVTTRSAERLRVRRQPQVPDLADSRTEAHGELLENLGRSPTRGCPPSARASGISTPRRTRAARRARGRRIPARARLAGCGLSARARAPGRSALRS